MSEAPLVSIICLCYNHERFVEEALLSVINQDYPNKEIIVVDDCSPDRSAEKIESFVPKYPSIRFIKNPKNIGNCKSFNEAFKLSKGEYIIDFATDDVMLPGKITKQVNQFSSLSVKYGVVYSDAEVIDEENNHLGYHHRGTARADFHPEGDIFKHVIRKYFICPPTMMIKREVLEATNGYDETLAYEDFNFWVLSSRYFYYSYLPEVLVKRRVVKKSLSMSFYTKGNEKMFQTTEKVIEKAFDLCETVEEKIGLLARIRFELRHAVMMEVKGIPTQYKNLLVKAEQYDFLSRCWVFIAEKKIPVFWLYKILLSYKGVFNNR